MLPDAISIGEAAKRSGVKVPTVRYYEQIGLLPPPSRTGTNRRLYSVADLRRLAFIRHARDLGFNVDSIRPCCPSKTARTGPVPLLTRSRVLGSKRSSSGSRA